MNVSKILVNILIFLICFFCLDIILFKQVSHLSVQNYLENLTSDFSNFEEQKKSIKSWYNERNNKYIFNDTNLNEKAIVFSGCSFMYGVGLQENQTLPYKIAKISKLPVYNVSIPGGGLHTLLFLFDSGIFDEYVSYEGKPQKIGVLLYNYGDFHIQRFMMAPTGWTKRIILYKKKGNDIVLKTSPFFLNRFTIPSLFNEKIFCYLYNHNQTYKNFLKEMLLLHFLKIKKELNKRDKDAKLVILVYQNSTILNEIEKNLEKEKIYKIEMYQDLNKDTHEKKYMLEDAHPSELIWDETAESIYNILKKIMKD